MYITYVAAVNIGRVQQVEWQRGEQIHHKPALQVVERDRLRVWHHFAFFVHERGSEIEQYVCEKNPKT